MARPKNPAVVRKVIALPSDLWERVNAWRHDRRIPTEAAGVRQLLERGLGAGGVEPDAPAKPRVRKGKFGA